MSNEFEEEGLLERPRESVNNVPNINVKTEAKAPERIVQSYIPIKRLASGVMAAKDEEILKGRPIIIGYSGTKQEMIEAELNYAAKHRDDYEKWIPTQRNEVLQEKGLESKVDKRSVEIKRDSGKISEDFGIIGKYEPAYTAEDEKALSDIADKGSEIPISLVASFSLGVASVMTKQNNLIAIASSVAPFLVPFYYAGKGIVEDIKSLILTREYERLKENNQRNLESIRGRINEN